METVEVKTPSFSLGDDGTLDTVIVCDACGEEIRFNFQYDGALEAALETETYDEFVTWAKEDATETHVCGQE